MATRMQIQEVPKSGNKKEESAVIEIQFCSNCDAHLFTVRHQENKYYLHFDTIRRRLQEQKIIVRKRTVPQNLYKKSPYCPSNVYYKVDTNEVVYFPQIGSFEIYFQGKKIFSKLDTLKWPTPEGIASEVQKLLQQNATQNKGKSDSQNNEKSAQAKEPTEKLVTTQLQHRKEEFRIKSKHNDEHLAFRYSIDRRNLFRKPQNNYLNRKSMTARNQSVSESTNRNNRTARFEKRNANQEEMLPATEEINKKELTDQAVLHMYKKKPIKNMNNHGEKVEEATNLPEIPKKTKKNPTKQANVYLQPIFPKSNINLENYARQKQIIANKIHEQRKNYEAQKQMKLEAQDKQTHNELRNVLALKAKFNENCNELLKNKDEKEPLHNIKEATEQNQIKQKEKDVVIQPKETHTPQEKARPTEALHVDQAQRQKIDSSPSNETHKGETYIKPKETKNAAAPLTHQNLIKHESSLVENLQEDRLLIRQPEEQNNQKQVNPASSPQVQILKQNEMDHHPEVVKVNAQQKVQVQQYKQKPEQEAYEAEFEEQNENKVQAQETEEVKDQPPPIIEATASPSQVIEDKPEIVNKLEEKQQYDEQFDKQEQIQLNELKAANTQDMAELINDKTVPMEHTG